MIIHSDVDKSEPEIDMDKICLICHDEIKDEDLVGACFERCV